MTTKTDVVNADVALQKAKDAVLQQTKQQTSRFTRQIFVCICHTNLEQNVYWENYAHWLGETREQFIVATVPYFNQLFEAGLRIATYKTTLENLTPAFYGETIIVGLWISVLRRSSVELSLEFHNKETGKLLARATQLLAFTDDKGKPIRIPEEIKEAVDKYVAKGKTL